MVWDRDDYVKEAQKQLGDGDICRNVNYKEKLLLTSIKKLLI